MRGCKKSRRELMTAGEGVGEPLLKQCSPIHDALQKADLSDEANALLSGKAVACLLIACAIVSSIGWSADGRDASSIGKMLAAAYFRWQPDWREESCALHVPARTQDAFLPPFNCSICEQLTEISKASHLDPDVFAEKFAYSALPLVVTDAMSDWRAKDAFSFAFFRELYAKDSPVMTGALADCQFFPYKSGFKGLDEVFAMSDADANGSARSWYLGWSNCDSSVANFLRGFYGKPYFLPIDSESSRMDWLFMGTPGYGAHMHIDHVGKPSWQAQISGRKLWRLEAPAECLLTCAPLEVIVEPGEIIVLDTNKWYHQTAILGNDLSITIGSEFD